MFYFINFLLFVIFLRNIFECYDQNKYEYLKMKFFWAVSQITVYIILCFILLCSTPVSTD